MSPVQPQAIRQRGSFKSTPPTLGGVLLLLGYLAGCQTIQNRVAQRSEHCGELCAQAREAREKGDADRANRYINEALRQRPNDVETRRQLAETMWSSGRQDEAIAHYLTLCEERASDVKLAERLSVMQWDANHRFAAANTANHVLRLDPQSKDALLIKARSDSHQGRYDDALVSYIKLSQIDPHDPVTLKELGELHLKRGQADRACPLFRTALLQSQIQSDQRAEIEWLLGMAYVESERWTMAVDMLERAAENRCASAEDWCLLGRAHLQTGQLEVARTDLQNARRIDPASESAKQLLMQLESFAGASSGSAEIIPVTYRPQ